MSYITAYLHRHIGQQCAHCMRLSSAETHMPQPDHDGTGLSALADLVQTKSSLAPFWFDASHIMAQPIDTLDLVNPSNTSQWPDCWKLSLALFMPESPNAVLRVLPCHLLLAGTQQSTQKRPCRLRQHKRTHGRGPIMHACSQPEEPYAYSSPKQPKFRSSHRACQSCPAWVKEEC